MSLTLLLLFLLTTFGAFSSSFSSPSIGSIELSRKPARSILRSIAGPELLDAAVELNSSNFDRLLQESPASFAIVEFFAHWCPACRNYKPQYEKVARLFNGPEAAHPGIILMARVDCALKINKKLCDRFSVGHYPMLLWGPPSKFASGGWEPRQDESEIQFIDDGRTADHLLSWINKRIGSAFSLDDEKYENEHLLRLNASDPGQIARAVYDVEEATAKAFDIILEHKVETLAGCRFYMTGDDFHLDLTVKMIKSETHASLIRFIQLLVVHHPSKRCRRGSAELLINFDDLWPSTLLSGSIQQTTDSHDRDALKNFQICGKEVPRGYWIFCRGSKNDTRGFSCGLWVLLHSLSVRVEAEESHLAFTVTCEFIRNFFICEECRQHFHKMCSRVSAPFNTTQDYALWLWSVHNGINERLMREEESLGTGDPKYPKVIWPPKQLCPSCSLSVSRNSSGAFQVEWNKEQVFNFLVSYYGKTLASALKDKGLSEAAESAADETPTSTNAVTGAAFAIALASCAFGVLAFLWRLRQKNQKYLRQLHPLKII